MKTLQIFSPIYRTFLAIAWIFLISQTTLAQWTNGQAATYVLGQPNFASNTAAAGANGMNWGEGMVIDATNNKLYVVDRNNHRVLRFAYPITANQPNVEVVFGQTNTTNNLPNAGGGVGAVGFNNPTGVAVNPVTGDIFVIENSNHRILRFASAHLIANGSHGPSASSVIGQPNFTTATPGTSQNQLNFPHAVIITPGFYNMWIVDQGNHRVLRIPNASITSTQPNFDYCLGQTSWTNNSSGNGANQLNSPAGICVNSAATWLFVADGANNRVLRFATPPAMVFNVNAASVLGQTGFGLSATGNSAAQMNTPRDVAMDASGILYVSDMVNNRVLTFNNAVSLGNGANADNVLGQTGFGLGGAGLSATQLNAPRGLAVNGTTLLVSEQTNNRVLQFNPSPAAPTVTSFIPTNAGPGQTVTINGTNFTLITQVQFGGTNALSYNVVSSSQINAVVGFGASGNVTVTNPGGTGSFTGFTYNSPPVTTLYAARTTGQIGTVRTDGTMQNLAAATGIGFGRDVFRAGAYIYWCNETGNTIGRANADGSSPNPNFITGCSAPNGVYVTATNIYWTNYGSTTLGRANLDGTGVNQSFCNTGVSQPVGIAVDVTGGFIYWSRTNFASIGRVALDGVTGLNAAFMTGLTNPGGIWIDNANNFIYFTQAGASNSIQRAQLSTGTGVTTLVTGCSGPVGITSDGTFLFWSNQGTGNIGRSLMSGLAVNQTFSTGFTNLRGISIGPNPAPGPTITTVLPASAQAGATITITGTNLTGATSVFIGNQSVSFTPVSATQLSFVVPNVSSSGLITVNTPSGSATSAGVFTYLATYVLGQTNFTTGTPGTLNNKFNTPNGMTIDAANNKLYVAEFGNHRVMRFSLPITQNSQLPEAVFGQVNFTSGLANGGGTTGAAVFNGPFTMNVGTGGDLWITDILNNRVVMIPVAHTAANGASATTVLGQPNLTSNAAGLSAQNVSSPYSTRLDASGNMWIVDNVNRRALLFNAPLSTFQSASVALGVPDFVTNNAVAASPTRTGNTGDIALVGTALYLTDITNHRILRFDAPFVTGMAASVVLGQPNFTTSTANNPNSSFGLNFSQDLYTNGTDLFVADVNNHRVLVYLNVNSKTSGAAPDAVIGQPNMTTLTSGLTQAKLNGLRDVILTPAGQLIIADQGNQRVLVFGPTFVTPAPTVTSFLPTSALAGATITIRGTNFTGTTQVQFGGVNAASFTIVSATEISAVVAAGGASGNVSITTPAGTGGLAGFAFIVAPTAFSAATPPPGTIASAYTYTFVANGSPAPTYAVQSGTLPPGLTLSGAGVLSGTPTGTGGTFGPIVIRATNVGGFLDCAPFNITINVAPTAFTAQTPPIGVPLVAYGPYSFVADGFPTPTYAVQTGGALPAGLTLSGAGVLSGTPSAGGVFGPYTIRASNVAGTFDTAPFSITLGLAPTAYSAQTPPSGALGLPYSYIFTANGIPAPTYTVQSGTLPTGLTLNTSTGALSGTPSATGTFGPITIRATNIMGTFDTAPFSIAINTAPTAFTAQTPPTGTSGSAYSYTFAANGLPAPTYSVFAGTLPPGLTLNPSTGALSGTPISGGTYSGIVIRASNIAGTFNSNSISITINGAPTSFVASPANGVVGTPYSSFFSANGFPAPTYSLFSGVLPTGLSLNASTGELSGTPTAAGVFGVTVIRASNGEGALNSNSFNITIAAAPSSPTAFSAQTPVNGTAGTAYSYTVVANGFPSPTYSVVAGTLPTGLTLNAATGTITGTPTVSGTFGPITVQSSNGSGTLNSTPFNITINGAPTSFSAQTPGNGVVGTPYNYAFAVNGLPASTFTVLSGTLPTGLSLSGAGVISGTPSVAATFGPITVQASNGLGLVNTSAFSITIAATGTAPTAFTLQSPPSGLVGGSYGYTFAANGSPAPSYAVNSGTLPAGLTLTAANGLLSGVPTAAGVFGPITLAATNGFGSTTSAPFNITVNEAPSSFTAQTPPNGAVGTAYSYTLIANGFPAPAYSLVSGALPAGLTLSGAGVISGTPSASGVFAGIVVKAQNAFGNVNTVSMSMSISAAVVAPTAFTAQTPPNGNQTVPYSYTFAANGSPSPTYSVVAGTLPTGLTLNAATGVLSGTPTVAGAFGPITIQAMNGAGSFNSTPFNISIQQAPPTITNFTPTGSIAGATITINGTNLTGVSAVSFGGVPAASFNPVSATQVTAVVAAGGATGNVSLTTPGGTVSLGVFSFFAPPTIAGFVPSAAAVGAVVTITGTNFTGATQVQFGGINAASFTVISPTQITAIVPGGAPNATISVTTPAGTIASVPVFMLVASSNEFYYQSGAADNPANWNTLVGGGGLTAGSFGTSGQTFYIPSGRTATFNTSTTVSPGVTLQVENGGSLIIPSAQTLTVDGIIRVNNGGRLRLEGSGSVIASSSVQYLGTNAVLEYANTSRTVTNNEFTQVFTSSLVLNAATVRLNETKSISGTFSADNASTLSLGTNNALSLLNAITMSGGSRFSTDSSNVLLIAGGGAITGDVIFGNGIGTPVIARLTMQRPNATLKLGSALRVSTTLTLQAGVIETQAGTALTVGNPLDTALQGGSASSFVKGALVRALPVNLNGANPSTPQFRFPVGKGSQYLPASIVSATTGSATTLVSVEAFDMGAGGSVAAGSAGSLSQTEHWQVKVLAGDLTQSRFGLTRDSIPNAAKIGASATKAGSYADVGGTKENTVQGARMLSSSLAIGASGTERFFAFTEILPTTPRIAAFTPSVGTTGTLLTVVGTNFTGMTGVRVGGVAVQSFTIVNSTTITAVLGVVATGAVQLTGPNGSATTTSTLTFIPPLGSGGMTGGSGGTGGTGGGTGGGGIVGGGVGLGGGITGGGGNAGGNPGGGPIYLGPGNPLVLTGLTPQQLIGLTIGGLPATFTFLPNGSVVITIPPDATTATLVIITPNGTITSTDAFAIADKPASLTISPALASTGAVISLTGSGFDGVSGVSVGGVNAAYTVNSDTKVSAIVPAGNVRMAEVVLSSAGGTVSGMFEYASTSSGGAGSGGNDTRKISLNAAIEKIATGGARVRVTGANLELITSLRLRTSLGATSATWSVFSPTEISVLVPRSGLLTTSAGTLSSAAVTIETMSASNQATLPNAFTLLLLPEVSNISRLEGNIGETIVLTGTNFQLISEIRIGDAVVQFRRESATTLVLTIPGTAGVPAAGALTLLGANGDFTQSVAVINAAIVAGLPIPLGFTPTVGSARTEIRVSGANMGVVAAIEVNGILLGNFRVVSPSDVRGVLSTMASVQRFGTVRLVTSTGGAVTLPGRFEFTESLEADSVEVASLLTLAGGRAVANWNRQTLIKDWSGVQVLDNRVVALSLRGAGLAGAIPAGLARLTKVRLLDLANNSLTGGIPSAFATLPEITQLNLSNNRLAETESLTTLCSLRTLRTLDVSRNAFVGAIPLCVTTMDLRTINLSNNAFSGRFPWEFAATNLEELRLAGNQLSGELPREFGTIGNDGVKTTAVTLQYHTLRVLDVSGNRLTGRIPPEWEKLPAMEELNLSNNRIESFLPPNLAAWKNIQVLRLENNLMEGVIPASLPVASLREVHIANNRFTGALPETFAQAARLRVLNIAQNRFTALPAMRGIGRLDTVRADSNRLQFASLEPNIGIALFSYAGQDSVGQKLDTTVLLSRTLRLTVNVSGTKNLYEWRKNGVSLLSTNTSANTPTLVVADITRQDEGVYSCRVTSSLVPNVVLLSRPVSLSVTTPSVTLASPTLVFPPQAAQNVGITTRLRWSRVEAAEDYNVIATRDSLLRDVVLRTTVRQPMAGVATGVDSNTVSVELSNLEREATYFWRVQSLNSSISAANANTWSPVNRFTTVPVGRELAFTTLDVGKAIIGEKSEARGVIINVSENAVTLERIQIAAGDQVFDLDSVKGRVLQPQEEIPVRIIFVPKEEGIVRATISVSYTDFMRLARNIVFEEALRARGTPLKALVVDFDTVRVGRRSLGSMLIVNRGNRDVRVLRAYVVQPLGEEQDIVYSVEGIANTVLAPQDTAFALIRCFPKSEGMKNARIVIEAEEDTTFAQVGAYARFPKPDDAVAVFGLRATPDSIAPGGAVTLELYLDEKLSSGLNKILRSAPPQFQGSVRFGSQVLALDASERSVRALKRGSGASARGPVTAIIPQTSWDGRNHSLLRFQARAVAGEVDKDALLIEDIKWGNPARKPEAWEAKVFVEDPITNYFTAQACVAGGKRLVTSAKATTATAVSPNPVKNGSAEVSYTVREDGDVVIELVNASGQVAKTLVSGNHLAGEYVVSFSTQDTPSGAYMIRLQAANSLVFKRVNIVR
jgi:Leucine-rich repeat (LRR) protein/sugar lactone lactonase YvrE